MPGPAPSFAELGLRPVVVHSLRRMGVDSPFPIQTAVLPDALRGDDVLGRAPTGSGKTLAFGLSLLQRLSGRTSAPRAPRAMVLVPTRELALQIERELEEPALASGIRLATVVGGVPTKRQVDRLSRGIDVVVATPGRLEDLVARGDVSLADVEITVVDEADRMSDLGFLPQISTLLDRTPSVGQRMLFSATLDGDVDILVDKYLRTPAVHVSESAKSDNIVRHHFYRVSGADRNDVASAIAARDGRTIIFLRTKHAVDRFTETLLSVGISAVALHGDKTQAARTRNLAAFAEGTVPVLVATDVAARGIHVDGISLVVHVDPPADAKDYTHRAGRTARAGAAGTVITLVTEAEQERVSALAAEAGIVADFEDVVASSPLLASTTGARTPPGRPVPAPAGAARSEPAVAPHGRRNRQRGDDSSRSTRGRGRGRGPR